MKIFLHRNFVKKYKKLSKKLKNEVKERRNLFVQNQYDPLLHNHALQGKWVGYRSVNITGDWRIIYKIVSDDVALFVDIDTP
ncbi:MAG: type II toxin-antitoxin system mRNA interferase toxin, RelE/StbE family [Patescibacteria group bacterium]|mgnify:CR=1 FL=1